MNAVYLYSRIMPYTIEGLKSLIGICKVGVHIFHYPVTDETPYQLPLVKGLTYYNESEFSKNDIFTLIKHLNPKFIYVSGWNNQKYLEVAKLAKKQKISVISGCDTQWRGDLRQIIAVVFSKILIRKYFDFLIVPGMNQYEYARLLGYKRNQILLPLLVADFFLFNKKYEEFLPAKRLKYPKNILFVGRFEKVKGLHSLIEAFKSLQQKNGWTLTLVGNGSLKNEIKELVKTNKEIIIKDFMQPETLVDEIRNAGAFCLPSIYEPWGVVLHEFASAGLPIITSTTCGASSVFVKEKFNGFLFETNNTENLKIKIEELINMSDDDLLKFSERSNLLAQSIKPEMYAGNFFQFLK